VLTDGIRLLPGGAVEGAAPRPDASVPLLGVYRRSATPHTARGHVHARSAEVLDLVRQGRLRPDLVVTGVHPMDAAPDVLPEGLSKPVFVRDRAAAVP
jgi:hypothetical protein